MKSPLLLAPLTCILLSNQIDAVVIVAEEAVFSPPESQAIFPAGNLNVFQQFVLGFEAEEQVGEKGEIDLVFTTPELKITGLIENIGYASVDGNASLWMSNPLVPFIHRPKQAGEPVRD
mgnify:CR=1 FL=1